jgi:Fic family protein
MRNKIYKFVINIDWKLINTISQIDRFDSNWTIIEKKEGRSLKQLHQVALVKNVAASTRIEGYKLTDEETKVLVQKYEETKSADREMNEITDYIDTLDALLKVYENIELSETYIMNIHHLLMRYKKRDRWFRNIYKSQSNAESVSQDVIKQILSHSVNDGFLLTNTVQGLIDWYTTDEEIHPLIKIAVFMYEFLCSFPFKDGNKRLSRLIPLFLLLKNGYKWVKYVSLESEIELRKEEYYKIVRKCQDNRPNENITDWVLFFLDVLIALQEQLTAALKRSGIESRLSPREKAIIALISNNPGTRSGEIANKLAIPNPTTKRILANLLQNGFIERYGSGRGTNYSVE